ncbi:hypothetical protein LCGC14_2202550 [marine sediment metagenome]|uniref:Uncharacterized protein n=1 Tax=marine sediment metagenome TaxID=412755 RepID=A0A0F9DGD0_9ZZZZ
MFIVFGKDDRGQLTRITNEYPTAVEAVGRASLLNKAHWGPYTSAFVLDTETNKVAEVLFDQAPPPPPAFTIRSWR